MIITSASVANMIWPDGRQHLLATVTLCLAALDTIQHTIDRYFGCHQGCRCWYNTLPISGGRAIYGTFGQLLVVIRSGVRLENAIYSPRQGHNCPRQYRV
jgi:hypothetical protein